VVVYLRKYTLNYLLKNIDLLDGLSLRDKKIMVLKYGLNGKKPMTLIQVSEMFNLTPARIGQITRKLYEQARTKDDDRS
jgi:DNA-directed RNA polymerase sigma subunit (sigma70/sigma32)